MNSSQVDQPYNNRKSLFDNQSRDVVSLNRQVPLSKVREFLAGSGKNSENSNHFCKSLASYFRPQRLGRKTRNGNNSVTEKIRNDVGPVVQDDDTMGNKSQVIQVNQPMT